MPEREARHREYGEQRRRQEDAVRRQREEEERRSALEQQARLWLKSQQLRTFIAECERVLVEQHGEVRSGSAEAAWLEWAFSYADQLDPLKSDYIERAVAGFAL